MVTVYVFRVTGMIRNLTKSQGSFLGKGVVIIRGSAHKVHMTSQTLSEAQCPPTPSHGQMWGRRSPESALPGWAALRPLEGWSPGAPLWSSFPYNFT